MKQANQIDKKSFILTAYWKEILSVFVLLLAVYFFRSQEEEIKSIIPRLKSARIEWVIPGVLTTIVYVLLQAWLYIKSFNSVGAKLSLGDAMELFLKRNLLSVFLPVGAVASLAYTPLRLQKKKVNSAQGLQASIINGYVGILTVFIVGVPIIIYTLTHKQNVNNAWLGLVLTGAILVVVVYVIRSFTKKGIVYQLINKISPSSCNQLESLFSEKINKKQLLYAIGVSMLIEFIGILMVYVSMKALGMKTSIEISAIGYILSILPMLVSPFLHGLGAVEFSLAIYFTSCGYTSPLALSATFLYRVFEFWLPLLLGFIAFLWKGKELIGRILPAAGIFLLGVINIVSVLKTTLTEHLQWELDFLPMESIHASKTMILFMGLALILVSANLLKGHKNAFILAVLLSSISIFVHLFTAFHYEEAIVAFFALVLLLIYRKEYRIKSDNKWLSIGFKAFIIAVGAVCIFDCIGFYLLEKKHFGIDFTLLQSLEYTLKSFFLISYGDLVPTSHFAKEFLSIVYMLAFGIWIFLLFTIFSTRKFKNIENVEEIWAEAQLIVNEFGNSSLDYFKLSRDKSLFLIPERKALVSYKIAQGLAVVLEDPVCKESEKSSAIIEFENYCLKNGLKTCYYRVGEESLQYFNWTNKKKVLLGQEAIVEVEKFSLSGSDHKSIRNGLNFMEKNGYTTKVCKPPHSEDFLNDLQDVSDEWLKKFNKQEAVFSEGMFDRDELENEKVIVVMNDEEKIVAFMNIIPDYAPDECTYDMLRRTVEATNGSEDALLIKLIEFARENGYKKINLGMASFTGINNPENTPEKIEKYASEKIKSLQHFHRLRSFKDKYATIWVNKYLIYDNDYDLWKIPIAIAKVMKPSKKHL
jgi:phosphatidylglycerol lysyltransferase